MEKNITMRSIVSGFSYVMDLLSGDVQDHHKKVSYLSFRLAEAMGLSEQACRLALFGGLLHDIGGVLREESLSLWEIESEPRALAEYGSRIVSLIPVDAPLAEIVRYSQGTDDAFQKSCEAYQSVTEWTDMLECVPEEERRQQLSEMIGNIIHVADISSLLFDGKSSVLQQARKVERKIQECSGILNLHPWVTEAFQVLSHRESVWMDLLYEPDAFLTFIPETEFVSLDKLAMFSEFASVIIDFRSPFTAMHSAGVSASAVELAKLVGMSGEECTMMKIAGNLHDIGKLKVPKAILEKPGKLDDDEFDIIKEHPYFTWKILKHMEGLEEITAWASFHHEKLTGNGYPFHLHDQQLHLGARILAVADIFAAITEDRPYRKGMNKEQALAVLTKDAENGAVSSIIVELLEENYETVNAAREKASRAAGTRYRASIGDAE